MEGIAVSSHELATRAGREVLWRGGNAVDAAVAMGFVLAVVLPDSGNIGGGGFAVVHLAGGRDLALDFRETAPARASRDMYRDAAGEIIPGLSTVGYLAAGVPGTVAGLCALQETAGSFSLREVMKPAIALAVRGYTVGPRQESFMTEDLENLRRFPATRGYFLKGRDAIPYRAGETFVQKDLARTLRLIARRGPGVFYTGEVAEMIAWDMAAGDGLVTMEDLAAYKPIWRQPLGGSYRGYDIVSVGPPSSGGVHVIQILNILESANLAEMGSGSSQTIHLLAEAMRYAYADRAEYLGDPDFTPVPVDRLTSGDYGRSIYRRIQRGGNRAVPSAEVGPGLSEAPREGNHTTHFSAVDSRGNAAAVTYTVNDWHGCRAAVPGAGFLLNNVMDDFASRPGTPNMFGLVGGEANSIVAGKRPLSCMAPVIVLKNGCFFLTLGSPGGSRIITTVLQVISNVIDHGMNLREAVAAPRIHMQWLPDELRYEPHGLVRDAADKLRDMGYTLTEKSYMGDVNAVIADPETGRLIGVEDPRREYQRLYTL